MSPRQDLDASHERSNARINYQTFAAHVGLHGREHDCPNALFAARHVLGRTSRQGSDRSGWCRRRSDDDSSGVDPNARRWHDRRYLPSRGPKGAATRRAGVQPIVCDVDSRWIGVGDLRLRTNELVLQHFHGRFAHSLFGKKLSDLVHPRARSPVSSRQHGFGIASYGHCPANCRSPTPKRGAQRRARSVSHFGNRFPETRRRRRCTRYVYLHPGGRRPVVYLLRKKISLPAVPIGPVSTANENVVGDVTRRPAGRRGVCVAVFLHNARLQNHLRLWTGGAGRLWSRSAGNAIIVSAGGGAEFRGFTHGRTKFRWS